MKKIAAFLFVLMLGLASVCQAITLPATPPAEAAQYSLTKSTGDAQLYIWTDATYIYAHIIPTGAVYVLNNADWGITDNTLSFSVEFQDENEMDASGTIASPTSFVFAPQDFPPFSEIDHSKPFIINYSGSGSQESFNYPIGTSPGETTVYIPHFTNSSAEWSDTLQVDNSGATAGSYTITMYNQGSEVYSGTFSIDGLTYVSHDLYDLLNGQAATCGKITYSGNGMNFRLAYTNKSGGGVAEFNLSSTLGSTMVFHFSNFSSLVEWKGLAMFNGGTSTVNVNVQAIGDGEVLETVVKSIAPNSQIVGLLQSANLFPGLDPDNITKVIVTLGDSSIQGITINGKNANDKLMFTPAQPKSL